MDKKKHLIVVPTYNEQANIEPLVNGIFKYAMHAEILFVDDNSQDGTVEAIEGCQKKLPSKIHILKRGGKLGLGTAYIAGFNWGLERKFDVLIEMDADLSHNPKYLPEMFNSLRDHDLVIGSRYVEGGGTKNWSFIRRFISRCGSLYARSVLGVGIEDFTGGFNAWHAHVLEAIRINEVASSGYVFQIELKYRAALACFSWAEVPIIFADRVEGVSKMSSNVVLEAVYRVLSLRFSLRKFGGSTNGVIEHEV